ncbi:MAG: hypothetical protein ACLRTA_09025 [Clostridia bacterium]
MQKPKSIRDYGISEQIFDDISVRRSGKVFSAVPVGKNWNTTFSITDSLAFICPNCGFQRPEPDFTASDIYFHDEVYDFDMDGMRIHSTARSPYNIYNTLSAYAALCAMDADKPHFQEMIENFDYGNNRESIFTIHNARVQLHLAKNRSVFQQKISLV